MPSLTEMTPDDARAFVEKSGNQLVVLTKQFREARPGSAGETEMRTVMEGVGQKLFDDPEVAVLIAQYLANVVCALNEALPARRRMF